MKDTSVRRFQILFLVAVLLSGLQSVAMPTIISAAEQEVPRRHSLIHPSAAQSAALQAKTQGTMLQSSSAEPTRVTSPIGPPQAAVSLPTMPLTHHRTLTKRPAIASTSASASSSQTLRAALSSGVAAGQITQITGDISKGTTPTATAPATKSMDAPLPVITSTGSVAVAPTAPSSSAGTAGVGPVASAGSGLDPSPSGSRSALNLLRNSALSSLLQPPSPPSTSPPPSPSAPPPPSPSAGNVILTWTANGEPDLAGYKVYVGTDSGTYNAPGSPFVLGKVARYTVSNLPKDQTYFFALSAYDSAGNESALSAEVSKSLY